MVMNNLKAKQMEAAQLQSTKEKRKCKRILYKEAVQYRLKEGNEFGGCLAHDLSEGGIRINTNDFVPLNTPIILNIRLSGDNITEMKGYVVWVHKLPYTDRYLVGLQFEVTDSYIQSKKEVHNYIQAHPV